MVIHRGSDRNVGGCTGRIGGNEWQPGLHIGSNGNYSLMADEIELWEEHRLSVVRHLTILLFVDWLPTGQWFAKSPFSLRAGIYFSPIARSKMAESCTYLPSVLPIALFHQPSGCSSHCCHYGVKAAIHFLQCILYILQHSYRFLDG